MANILHLDESEVACRAMRGILSRAGHRCITISTTGEAWTSLRELVKFDLAFVELKLKGENGLSFISMLREDCFLQHFPVVVYSSVADQVVVKKALSLNVQNYLIKPYNDASIYAEIAKAAANPWRNLLFEEEKSFCAQMGFTPTMLKEMRTRILQHIDTLVGLLPVSTVGDRQHEVSEALDVLSGESEAAGFWGLVELTEKMKGKIEVQRWDELPPFIHDLDYAKTLLFTQIHPEILPEGFLSDQEKKEKEEAKERSRWVDADVSITGPLVQKSSLLSQIEGLPGCPVIDTVAASFSMYADGQASNLSHLSDLVSKDPGLAAQVLVAVNKLERENMNPVEDPQTAISLLGELRLNALAKALPTVEERYMQVPPVTWPHYWMFLMGVARLSQFTCASLELNGIESMAHTAGLLHDIGKLLLLKLQPFAFEAIITYTRAKNVPLATAEQNYLGITTREMGHHFASLSGLPSAYVNVISWVESPTGASADAELVAAVSLARMLCLHNHVGFCGDTPRDQCPPIEETPAWEVLKQSVFPSFNLKQFEARVHAFCKDMRMDLLGRIK
jgi:CheY-like chemotaxis protein/HD-like signal output (HDOD) protein